MRCPALALELLVLTCGACSSREDVAAVIVVDSDAIDEDAEYEDAGSRGLEADAASALIVVGQPLGNASWPHPIATWPLSTPLREFFADDVPPSGKRVRVEGPDASALDRLWQAVQRGQYGPQMSAAVVEDASGDHYLLLFQSI
jgi:hypothetical protein